MQRRPPFGLPRAFRGGRCAMWDAVRFAVEGLRQKAVSERTLGEILDVQRARLRRLVAHAKAASPFYAERLRGIDPERFKLADLPTVTKSELMGDFDRVVTDRSLSRDEIEEFL